MAVRSARAASSGWTSDVLLVLFIVAGAYSLVDVFAPQITLEGDSQAMTGGSIGSSFPEGRRSVAMLYLRHMGVAGFAFGVAAVFITLGGFARGQHWAWWALLLVVLLLPVKAFFGKKAGG